MNLFIKIVFFTIIFSINSCTQPKKTNNETHHSIQSDVFNIESIYKQIGSFQFKSKAEIKAEILNSSSKNTITNEEVMLKVESPTDLSGYIHTNNNLGIEFVFKKGIYCVRKRYGIYVCRKPDEGEPDSILSFLTERPKFTYKLLKNNAKIVKSLNNKFFYELDTNKSAGFKDFSFVKLVGEITSKQKIPYELTANFILKRTNSKQQKIRVSIQYSHNFITFKGKIKLPASDMRIDNIDRQRPLMDRKAILGKKVPKPLQYLY